MTILESPARIPDLELSEKNIPAPSISPLHAGLRETFTPEQEKAFDDLLALCRSRGLSNDSLDLRDNDCRDGIDDEASLFRFLKARKFDVAKAFENFEESMQSRKANELAELYRTIDLDLYEETRMLYPHWTGRRDRRGIPVYILDLSLLNYGTLTAHKASSENLRKSANKPQSPAAVPHHLRRVYVIHDHLVRFVFPLCSAVKDRPNPEIPITRHTVIVDISELGGLMRGWKLKDFAMEFDKLLNRAYPEILEMAFIIGAPSYFSVIWNWLKPLLDPVTVSKVQILSPKEVLPVLEEYMDKEDIPVRYGGKLPTKPGMMPQLDAKLSEVLQWSSSSEISLPPGPLHWVNDPDGSRTAVAVGAVKGEQRRSEFASLR